MKKISHFYDIKKGDCYLFKPKKTKDKRKTTVMIGDETSEVFALNEKEVPEKISWNNESLSLLTDFYLSEWSLYKLNKNETKKHYKEIILNSL